MEARATEEALGKPTDQVVQAIGQPLALHAGGQPRKASWTSRVVIALASGLRVFQGDGDHAFDQRRTSDSENRW